MENPLKRRDGARPAVPRDVELRPTDSPADRGPDMPPGLDDFFGCLRDPERNTDKTQSAAAFLLLLIVGLIILAFAAIRPDAGQSTGGQSAPNLSAHEKRLASKAAYTARRSADPAFRENERQRARKWRRNHPDKAHAQKARARAANYHRPFVAIDSEGQNYPGDDILYQGVRHPRHDTYLWGAAADDGRSPSWLMSPETHGLDKRPLSVAHILEWLLSLPERFGPAIFTIFSGGYDSTQILKHLPYEKVWEIEKRETYPDRNDKRRRIGHSPVLWKGYAVSYIKGKSFDLWRLRDPDKPYARGKDGAKHIDASAHIRIYDVFGFFQSSFSAVVKSMVDSGRATQEEADFIAAMKDRRDQFGDEDVEQIKAYTTLELRLLARMMGDLRAGFEQIGLRLRHWHGAGAAASALIETQGLKKHYGADIAASDISPQQTAAHHAYYGGRIELLKQGFLEGGGLHVLDIASAYSAAMVEFPSLAGGAWISKSGAEFRKGSLSELRAAVEGASILSMFKIRYQFPTYERYDPDARKAVFIPFYPLPYRDRHGGILFPASGYCWCMREEALGAISWLERFVPDYPRPRRKHHRMAVFEIEEAWIFEPGREGQSNQKPFEFIRDLFVERRQIKDAAEQTGRYDIREKTIKLSLSSIYGKLAQSVGGDGEAPSVANPYYAAATTASCRRRLIEAALIDPHAIVFFATDGIVSTRPLIGLARVKKAGDAVELGDWEYNEADGGLFVMPGVYTYGKVAIDETGERTIKPVTKIRGGDAKKYAATVKANQWLIENVLAAWRKPFDPRKPETFPRIVAPYQKYITVGNALASRPRWKLAGRWTARPGDEGAGTREINVHGVGNKRELIPDERCWPDYVSIPGRDAGRCNGLIRTLPALNNDASLSRPRMPEWLDERIGEKVQDREEQEEIAAGFE